MYITLKRNWSVLSFDKRTGRTKPASIEAGRYEVKRIKNPTGRNDQNWLVLVNEPIGAAEVFWRTWTKGSRSLKDSKNPKSEIVIEEE